MENLVNVLLPFFKDRKVLVTGHTGFKGTWLTRVLLQAGAQVTGYSLNPPTEPSIYTLTNTKNDIRSETGDVRDLDQLTTVFQETRPEIVFHLAAQPIVRLSYADPVNTYSTNVMGTVNILEVIRKTPSVKSFVNVTTDKVYHNKEWLWGYREKEELCGYDPYSNSKSCSELVTYSFRNSFFLSDESPAISTARSGNVIGGGDFAKDRIIPDCVRSALSDTEIVIRNPHSVRPYQHVLECLSGYLLLAKKQYEDKQFSGSYNFGPNDDGCVSTGMLVQRFCDAWKGVSWKVQGDGGPHEANFLKLDCSKAKALLGWTPHWDIERAIAETVAWTKGYQSNLDMGELTDSQITSYFL